MDIAGWEEKYRSGDRGREDAPTILVVETAEKLAPGTVLDLACGAGRNALYLAEQGWAVTALDGSEKAVELVQVRAATRGLEVHAKVADLTDPNFIMLPDAFDLIVIAYYLQPRSVRQSKGGRAAGWCDCGGRAYAGAGREMERETGGTW
jgi:SAM-dependent methyltransferase